MLVTDISIYTYFYTFYSRKSLKNANIFLKFIELLTFFQKKITDINI